MTSDLILRRIFKAPRALVWRCWTEPELLMEWFCPRPHRLTEVKVDLRPGGQWFIAMEVNGSTPSYDGSVLEVVPGEKLVTTDLLLSDYRPVDKPFLGYTATTTLKDHPEGTEYTALARHRTPQSALRHDKMGFTEGWGTCADQLAELLATMKAA